MWQALKIYQGTRHERGMYIVVVVRMVLEEVKCNLIMAMIIIISQITSHYYFHFADEKIELRKLNILP
jgi:hypothetical protein